MNDIDIKFKASEVIEVRFAGPDGERGDKGLVGDKGPIGDTGLPGDDAEIQALTLTVNNGISGVQALISFEKEDRVDGDIALALRIDVIDTGLLTEAETRGADDDALGVRIDNIDIEEAKINYRVVVNTQPELLATELQHPHYSNAEVIEFTAPTAAKAVFYANTFNNDGALVTGGGGRGGAAIILRAVQDEQKITVYLDRPIDIGDEVFYYSDTENRQVTAGRGGALNDEGVWVVAGRDDVSNLKDELDITIEAVVALANSHTVFHGVVIGDSILLGRAWTHAATASNVIIFTFENAESASAVAGVLRSGAIGPVSGDKNDARIVVSVVITDNPHVVKVYLDGPITVDASTSTSSMLNFWVSTSSGEVSRGIGGNYDPVTRTWEVASPQDVIDVEDIVNANHRDFVNATVLSDAQIALNTTAISVNTSLVAGKANLTLDNIPESAWENKAGELRNLLNIYGADEADDLYALKADKSTTYTQTQVDALIAGVSGGTGGSNYDDTAVRDLIALKLNIADLPAPVDITGKANTSLDNVTRNQWLGVADTGRQAWGLESSRERQIARDIKADKATTYTQTNINNFLNTKLDARTGSVVAGNIGVGAVTTIKIADDSVTVDKIVNSAVDNSKLANGAVTTDKIANNTIITNQIASRTITGSKLASRTITGSKLAFLTITGSKIADDTITPSKLSFDPVIRLTYNNEIYTSAHGNAVTRLTAILNTFYSYQFAGAEIHEFIALPRADNVGDTIEFVILGQPSSSNDLDINVTASGDDKINGVANTAIAFTPNNWGNYRFTWTGASNIGWAAYLTTGRT